ncbi:MAG: diaminopimelate decarboxylase [Gemmatimonadetes bacterium]|nr:diaminopimelate decarboxylase [Gemmatimonadota bacterium]MBT8477420.1 diaminopimelate decarboxylase [Gemmatimonadota bacterium]NNK48134.1 diaminopimelate decarboxylase [Gemmatimonadota bacterium]
MITSLDPTLLAAIVREQGTPTYVYDARILDAGVRRWIEAVGDPSRICYAVKANYNLGVLAHLASHEIGFEASTVGEMARALAAGVPASRVVLGGVPKSPQEVDEGVRRGLDLVVLQAAHEVEAAVRAGATLGGSARVGLRVRPGIRAGAHPSLETGRADAKFGFGPEEIPEAWEALAAAGGLEPTTLAFHLGSGLESLEPYEAAIDVLLGLVTELEASEHPVRELDLGGGLGVSNEDAGADLEPADLVRIVRRRLEGTDLQVRYEPGRSIAARAGTLVTRVLYRRERDGYPALVCDGGFTDFGRFSLYGAQHRIEPLEGALEGPATVEVLGPTCESGDKLGTERPLHGVRPGDLLAVRDVGAYGFVMASNYNARPRPAEVLVDAEGWRVVRERETLADLWRGETVG